MRQVFKVGDVAKRLDSGARVRIVDVRPVGTRIFYVTEDCKDGHTTLFGEEQLRPINDGDNR